MRGRSIRTILSHLSRCKMSIRRFYQKIAVWLYIRIRPPIHRFRLKFRRSRPWLAAIILAAILGSCGTFWALYAIGGSYTQQDSSAVIVANVLDYLRRTGVIKDVDPGQPLFEPAPCMFGGSETWRHYGPPEQAELICGFVEAPLFHESPDGRTIKVPVAIFPSNNPNPDPDPIFLIQGGPGGASLDLFPSLVINFFTLPRNRDLVMVDQRGTRYAEPSLKCREDDFPEPIDESVEAEEESYLNGLEVCFKRLDEEAGGLEAFTTPQMAGDIDAVRRALGYEQLNFYGVSYGTHIGQYLMKLYPDSIRSVILDGVAPIPFDYINRMLFTHDRVLEQLFVACEINPTCSRYYPDLEDRMQSLLEKLDRDPVEMTYRDPYSIATYKDEMDGYDLVNMMMGLFYYDRSYALLPYLIQQAEQGNFEYFELMGDYTYFDGSFSSEIYLTVLCSEHEEFQFDKTIAENTRSWLRSYEGEDWFWYSQACSAWDVKVPENRLENTVASDIPVLLLSGQYDPITPPEYAEQVRYSLPNSYHVVDPKGSHGIAFTDECSEKIFNDFTDFPEEEPDHTCLLDEARHVDVVPPDSIQLEILMNGTSPITFLQGYAWVFGTLLVFITLDSVEHLMGGIKSFISGQRHLSIRKEHAIRRLHQLFVIIFTLSAIIYCVSMIAIIRGAQTNRNFSDAFAIPGDTHSIFALPSIMIILGFEVFITGSSLWRHGVLTRRQKNYFGLFSFISLSLLVFLVSQGLVMLPF